MKKQQIPKICSAVSLVLLLGFFLKLARDWYVYNTTLNSAPFSLWVLVDAVYFLLPALCVFLAGRFLQVRISKKSQEHDTDTSR